MKYCPNLSSWLDITARGHDDVRLSCCIESWAGHECILWQGSFESAAKMSLDDVWQSPKARYLRNAWQDGVPSMCSECQRLACGYEPVIEVDAIPAVVANSRPSILNLAYDRSCNLSCFSCRVHPIMHQPGSDMHAKIKAFQDAIVRPLLANADRAFLAGLGDPFGSPLYWELLSTVQPIEAPYLIWYILTNGQGFTPANYEAIPTRAQIDSVQFSIDAATPATYRLLRGGNWSRLIDNLAFVGQLRREGRLKQLDISMVVQYANYKEIPAFLDLGKAHSVDTVVFNALLNQRTYSDEDYRGRAVHKPDHQAHKEAMALLEAAKAEKEIKAIVEMPRGHG